VGSSIPLTSNDQPGVVDSPPIYAPQLSLGIRWADRLKPHLRDWDKAHQFDEGKVEDHMATERWDVELDVIYYLTSVYDRVAFTNRNAVLQLRTVDENGVEASIPASVGDCLQRDPTTQNCTGRRLTKTSLGGKDQLTVRLGGDYNILPGYASLRAGVSYETNGQEVEMLNVLTYLLGRTGLHAGFTLRVADKTDISFGFAHFIHRDVKLQVNPASDYPRKYKAPDVAAEYNFEPGAGEADFSGEGAEGGDFDGVAGVEVPNAGQEEPGPYFINAGTFTYDMQVMSVSFTQHF
jgi:hypothetical protein